MKTESRSPIITPEAGVAVAHDHRHDGIDRRGFLKCMAWVGTGTFCVMKGGVLSSYSLGALPFRAHDKGELSFVQISDSHMGFDKPANTDVVGTFKAAIIHYTQGLAFKLAGQGIRANSLSPRRLARILAMTRSTSMSAARRTGCSRAALAPA